MQRDIPDVARQTKEVAYRCLVCLLVEDSPDIHSIVQAGIDRAIRRRATVAMSLLTTIYAVSLQALEKYAHFHH